jgi:CYTH domain-containing protein
MGVEIEKKFLVINEDFKKNKEGSLMLQGFLSINKKRNVRVRIWKGRAFLTIKGKSKGAYRQEFEYEIPKEDAQEMMDKICKKPVIKKVRYQIRWGSFVWDVDEFLDENQGLVIAEIELASEDQEFEMPDWIGREITSDKRYYNAYLVKHPFTTWT